jgi:hypothetical protein
MDFLAGHFGERDESRLGGSSGRWQSGRELSQGGCVGGRNPALTVDFGGRAPHRLAHPPAAVYNSPRKLRRGRILSGVLD